MHVDETEEASMDSLALNRSWLVLSDDTSEPRALSELEHCLKEAHDHEASTPDFLHRGLKAFEKAFEHRFYVHGQRSFCEWYRSNCFGCQTKVWPLISTQFLFICVSCITYCVILQWMALHRCRQHCIALPVSYC